MSIHVLCGACGAEFDAPAAAAGDEIPCESCGEAVRVPGRDSARGPSAAPSRALSRSTAGSALPPQARSGRSRGGDARSRGRRRNAHRLWLISSGAIIGLVCLAAAGLVVFPLVRDAMQPSIPPVPPLSGSADEPFPLATVPVPEFPPLREMLPVAGSRAAMYEIALSAANPGSSQPGTQGRLRLYLPPGSFADKSLGCILIAPAGTNLLVGNDLDDATYHSETLPYVEAGYAVVSFSLDGALKGSVQTADARKLAEAYRQFHAAHAGLVNARNALEFVLARVPQVDPQRLFAAGHSSAGVLALLFAEHEPRLKGCIAFAPASDVEARLGELTRDPAAVRVFPGIAEFIKRSSPRTHLDRLDRQLFLFHAADDSNEPVATSEQFAADLQRRGKPVTFYRALRGDHYQSMIDEGIPRAIDWLKQLPGES